METNKGKGGRPKDEIVDSYIEIGKDESGKPIKICKFCGHRFSKDTSSTRIRFHLAKVEKKGVRCCTMVPPEVVQELAKNSMSSSSSKRSNANIPSNSDSQLDPSGMGTGPFYVQPNPPEMDISNPLPPQNMLDGSLQQSNVDPMDMQLNTFLQDNRQQTTDTLLDVLMQRTDGMQFDPSGRGHEPPREMSSPPEDFEQFMIGIFDNTQGDVNQMTLDTSHPNESSSMPLPTPHPVEQLQREQDAPQDMLIGGVLETPPSTPQHNESCSAHSILASQRPRQQHPREDHNHLPDQELLQNAAGMDSAHDATTPQNLLQRGACPDSFPDPTHQNDMAVAEFGNHEGLRSQNHTDPLLHSLDSPTSTLDQAKHNKRKLGKRPTGKKLPMGTIFEGSTFNEKVDEIYGSLKNDSKSRIGVCGMGGAGKTTIMKRINNLILEDDSMPFGHVLWVTVSQDYTIPKLQRVLAGELHITLPHDEDQEVARAGTLHEKMQDMCYVLILDDVWDKIDLEKVGIPEPDQENRCKLILTTRSLDVCNQMDCNPAIKLDLFSQKEAWELFVKTLDVTPEDSIIQDIMKEVAEKCACLPLAIVTVAGSMKGVHDIREWRNALNSLRSRTYGFTNMEKNVIEVLKFSYDRLGEQLQQCLLSCALFPEDHLIWRSDLIEMLISEGHIRSDKSLKSAYDEGHTMVNKLENACLLTRDSRSVFVIHDLIRDMCLDIMGGRFLVKCGSEFPPEESEYTEVLEKVFLMYSQFEEIPPDMAPKCPKLSSLWLSENFWLTRLSNSFFANFPRLKVLNLSRTQIQVLPTSVINLVSLNALVLQQCRELTCLPCLTPLKALKQLDLWGSGIEEAPEGLEELVNLTYLDLEDTPIETPVSSSILTNLVKLQYLGLPDSTKITMKDVREFKELEVLRAVFANWEEFSKYVNSRQLFYEHDIKAELTCVGASCASMSYGISSDDEEEGRVRAELLLREDHNTIGENRLSSEVIGQIPSPEVVRHLVLRGLGSEPDQGETRENGELKGIFGATVLFPFSNLVKLNVHHLKFTEDLISASSSVVESSSSPKVLLPCFQNLQVLMIHACMSLESILVSTANPTEEEEEEESNNPISFPNLRELALQSLPNLRSICDGTLMCPSIEIISVSGCPKLKRLPLQLPPAPVLGNNNNNNSGQLSLPPPLSSLEEISGKSEWWESLEWDQPHAKPLLQPYFKDYWMEYLING